MIQSVETIGLRVESITPEPHMINTNVNTDIQIKFNSDLNTTTVVGNFTVLHDKEYAYTGPGSLSNHSLFTVVKGNVSYKDKTIIFTPEQPLQENARYLICIRANGIKDVLGRTMLNEYISMFYTEASATLPKCQFTAPAFGTIKEDVPQFQWLDQQSKAYIFQISKEPTFEVLSCDVVIRNNSTDYAAPIYQPQLNLTEGLYYARVKSINGMWSDNHQFFIKKTTDAVVALEDAPESILLEDPIDDEIEILEMFPADHSVQVDTKINIVYIKVAGKVDAKDIDFSNSFLVGELSDVEDEDTISAHGTVEGSWNVVYDELRNVTYIIFTPVELGGVS